MQLMQFGFVFDGADVDVSGKVVVGVVNRAGDGVVDGVVYGVPDVVDVVGENVVVGTKICAESVVDAT